MNNQNKKRRIQMYFDFWRKGQISIKEIADEVEVNKSYISVVFTELMERKRVFDLRSSWEDEAIAVAGCDRIEEINGRMFLIFKSKV